jgi:fermentation-respiration switch protein FrsA (DUF1100 family)
MHSARTPAFAGAALVLASALWSCGFSADYIYDVVVSRNGEKERERARIGAMYRPSPSSRERNAIDAAWIAGQPYETVAIRSEDGLKLVGYYLPAERRADKTVILAHGYAGRGFDMAGFAEYYREQLGYNVLMPDARGHGASEGEYVGFGWPDRRDYLLWIAWVLERVGNDSRIVLHGVSMGASTVLMASGEDLPDNVDCIIEDCGYTSLDDELTYQLKRIYHVGRDPSVPELSKLMEEKVGYSVADASAIKQVLKSTTPTLFIHGDADSFVPIEMARRLYDACAASKEILIVRGAGHAESAVVDPKGYEERVAAFLKEHVYGGIPAAEGAQESMASQ